MLAATPVIAEGMLKHRRLPRLRKHLPCCRHGRSIPRQLAQPEPSNLTSSQWADLSFDPRQVSGCMDLLQTGCPQLKDALQRIKATIHMSSDSNAAIAQLDWVTAKDRNTPGVSADAS